ncbi:DNA polymerase/3'-5' exonuclease PolX [Candidatus Woesearchaeota archaeon]|nr:DNA polymerase/3'-5' exonuclease PolX [Candidatus Woesearchaeota archaeon]
MKNFEVAELLRNIAQLLEIQGELIFKIRAYEKAALTIENLEEDITEIWKQNKLEELPGIGKALAEKISEFLKTGKLDYYEKLKKQVPVKVEELRKIPGLGPKTTLKLYKRLNIKTVNELEKAAKEGKIQEIEGLGATVEHNLLKSIEFAKSSGKRFLLGHALDIAEEIKNKLKSLSCVDKIEIAGSLRRRKETIGDIDILAESKKAEEVMSFFTKMNDVEEILAKGNLKSSVRLKEGLQADLRIVEEKSYGAALLYFTGSKQHNIALRKIAIKRGMKLSEYGIFDKKSDKMLAGKTEEECYKKLGLQYIEPEIREDESSIEAAKKGILPKLIGYKDIKGDLQMHTEWSDGNNTIEEMAAAAKQLGYEYICITDHTGQLKIANALDKEGIVKQRKEIDRINEKLQKKLQNFTILQGIEVNIKNNGALDMKNDVLKQIDIVLASIHSGFRNPKEKITDRIIKAMENEHVDIIAHPFGRLINSRPGLEMDFYKILEKARETKTVLEINAYPERLDLSDVHVRAAINAKVKLSIGTDSHDASQLRNCKLGIAVARRGWAEKKDIINSYALNDMIKLLKL